MNLNDVLYIKELGYNFSSTSSEVDLIPIVLDATINYSKKYSATVSNSPVGNKTDRADHYRVKPSSISFSGNISNLDIGIYSEWAMNSVDASTQRSNQEDAKNRAELEEALGNHTYTSEGGTSRAQQYVERLEKLIKNKVLIELRVPDGLTTTNCLLTSLDISRNTKSGDGFSISATATQIQIIDGVIISEPAPDIKDTVAKKEEGGTGAGTEIKVNSVLDAIVAELKGELNE